MFALLMMTLPRSPAVIPLVIAIGLISALPSGPIMSLPARVLQPQTRAIGMGIFYTVYYAAMMLGPGGCGRHCEIDRQCGGSPRLRDGGPACLSRSGYWDTTGLLRRDRRPREGLHFMQPPITHR